MPRKYSEDPSFGTWVVNQKAQNNKPSHGRHTPQRISKLHEITRYVTVNIPGALSTFSLIMNQGAWDRLTEEQKAVLDGETGEKLSLEAAAAFRKAGEEGMALLQEAKVELITLDEASRKAFADAMKEPVEAFLTEEGKKAGFDGLAFVNRFKTQN